MEEDFGFVQDVCADLESGTITSIIVPGSNKVINIFSNANDIVIPWQQIKCIRRRYYSSWNITKIKILHIIYKKSWVFENYYIKVKISSKKDLHFIKNYVNIRLWRREKNNKIH